LGTFGNEASAFGRGTKQFRSGSAERFVLDCEAFGNGLGLVSYFFFL
jgi:hypothetical protein